MFADPLVDQKAVPDVAKLDSWDLQSLQEFDLIVIAMRQEGLDFKVLPTPEQVCIEWWCP